MNKRTIKNGVFLFGTNFSDFDGNYAAERTFNNHFIPHQRLRIAAA